MTTEDRLIELDPASCRQLLATQRVGRLAYNDQPSPTVVPVNFVLHGDAVAFRSGEGSKLDGAHWGVNEASFQVDGVDDDRRSGWSVLARGRLEIVAEPKGEWKTVAERVEPLAGGDRPLLVLLHIQSISGRRIAPDQAWALAHVGSHQWRGLDASDLMG